MPSSRRLFLAAALTSLLLPPFFPAAAQPAPGPSISGPSLAGELEAARLSETFEAWLEENMLPHSPGMAVAIVAGDVSALRTWGTRHQGENGAVDPHTVFRLASVSKAFAAATAGVLVEEGSLSWDMPAMPHLPGVQLKDPELQARITLRHVLSNSTGLLQHTYTDMVENDVPYEKILGYLDKVDFVCAPGACYSYQNVVYSFSGEVMRSVTGQRYEDLLRERLLRPLGMLDASVSLEDYVGNPNHATPHQRARGGVVPVKVKQSYYNVAPAAGVNASISDMQQWLQALLGRRQDVLPNRVLNELYHSHTRVRDRAYTRGAWQNVNSAGYGLGWRIFDYAGTPVAFHGGWVQGFHAEIVVVPSRGIGMALLMNSDHTGGRSAAPAFLDIALGLGNTTLARQD